MRTVCDYTDFFVIATGGNPRQTKAISDEVHVTMKHDHGLLPRAVAGERDHVDGDERDRERAQVAVEVEDPRRAQLPRRETGRRHLRRQQQPPDDRQRQQRPGDDARRSGDEPPHLGVHGSVPRRAIVS